MSHTMLSHRVAYATSLSHGSNAASLAARCPPRLHAARPAVAAFATAADPPSIRPPAARRPATPLVKVCGLTSEADAALAAGAGADFLGIIMWPGARRAVPPAQAASIAAAGRAAGAKAVVGVFVDEDADAIVAACSAAGITTAQLHGDGARAALPHLPPHLSVVYVISVDAAGKATCPTPAQVCAAAGMPVRTPEWVLVDGVVGGSGEAYEWSGVDPSTADHAAEGWLLAGGLGPANVAAAVSKVRPSGVDVSSGVCGPDGLAKDGDKVRAFVRAAKACIL
jgi:phosphoribosylanthranilate isomerase